MSNVPKHAQDDLKRIQRNIENSHAWFKDNYARFNNLRKYIFKEQLDENYLNILRKLKKPQLEFNILEAFLSRLKGEFSKNEPSVNVGSSYGAPVDTRTMKAVEDHFRFILDEAKKSNTFYSNYDDSLSGGFSVLKVWTDYVNDMSMDQCIKMGRAYHPALCGFDPLATEPHKGDGRFSFEIFPREEEEFKKSNPNINLEKIKYTRNTEGDSYSGIGGVSGFQWSYQNQKEKILIVVDYYEKKKKKVKIAKIADNPITGPGKVMKMAEYKEMVEKWDSLTPPPVIVGEPRWTDETLICRYKIIEDQVTEYEETDYTKLPHVFVDGNSELLQDSATGRIQQVTRPYFYNAKGMQDLKNFAGNALAAELENVIQHKFMIAEEAIPEAEAYKDAYLDVQTASLLVYKAYSDKEQVKPLPPPQVIARQQIPPQIAETFIMSEQTIQAQLGSYDASLGINDNQLSGVAIVEAATQSNAAAMPYITNMMVAISRAFEIILDLIPKYYVTPRTIPTLTKDGKRSDQLINAQDPNAIKMQYSANDLNVRIEAGLNFAIQKNKALQQIVSLSQAMPIFGQFMNTVGLPVLLSNLEIKDIDLLKDMAGQFQQQMQQAQQQAAQNNPQLLLVQNEQMKTQLKAQTDQSKMQLDNQVAQGKLEIEVGKLAIEEEKLSLEKLKLVEEQQESQRKAFIDLDRHMAEKIRAAVDLEIQKFRLQHDTHVEHRKLDLEERKHHANIEKQQEPKPVLEPLEG